MEVEYKDIVEWHGMTIQEQPYNGVGIQRGVVGLSALLLVGANVVVEWFVRNVNV